MYELEILKWVAGSSEELPRMRRVDEDRLLELIALHRLSCHFLHRLNQRQPDWCSSRLVAGILSLKAQALSKVQKHLEAAREIHSAVSSNTSPLITIKGFTAYALTGEARHIRYSEDLDLVFGDLGYLWSQMEALGYAGKKHELSNEYASMFRGEVMVELHRYVEVWPYPTGILTADHNFSSLY